eukprot:scaffold17207_cov36-Tisochrysis_lutea.AAC.1
MQPTSGMPTARIAATVFGKSPAVCVIMPAYGTAIPFATKPLSSSGIDSDQTQMIWRPMRWTA